LISIQEISLPVPGLDLLLAEAQAESYDFVDSLVEDWENGDNCFDGPGEALYGCFEGGLLVGVGGLNLDPFAGDATLGRIRRVYVRQAWRNRGIGRALIAELIRKARQGFRAVRLRAENNDAARLYERMGFSPIASPDATHILYFDTAEGLA